MQELSFRRRRDVRFWQCDSVFSLEGWNCYITHLGRVLFIKFHFNLMLLCVISFKWLQLSLLSSGGCFLQPMFWQWTPNTCWMLWMTFGSNTQNATNAYYGNSHFTPGMLNHVKKCKKKKLGPRTPCIWHAKKNQNIEILIILLDSQQSRQWLWILILLFKPFFKCFKFGETITFISYINDIGYAKPSFKKTPSNSPIELPSQSKNVLPCDEHKLVNVIPTIPHNL